jgi:hypothetical protein
MAGWIGRQHNVQRIAREANQKSSKIYRRIFTAPRGRETRQEKLKPYLKIRRLERMKLLCVEIFFDEIRR